MSHSRRDFLTGASVSLASLGTGCVSRCGHPASYATQIVEPQHHNTESLGIGRDIALRAFHSTFRKRVWPDDDQPTRTRRASPASSATST